MKQALDSVYLSDLSPKDKPWDKRRAQADGFKALYQGTVYHKYAVRLADCSCQLIFAFQVEDLTGVCKLKLQAARFCRVRLCPVCQGRRALMWAAKTIKIMPKVLEANPKARFIMLTLTVGNCPLPELRSQLSQMHTAWTKLVRRKEWKVEGWIRTTEVTRGKDDSAHPHYHCLLMVKPSYFGGDYYISQRRWAELWQECLNVSYTPVVDVRAIRAKKRGLEGVEANPVMSALVETIKYSVKPADVLKGHNQKPGQRVRMTDQEWLVELTSQLHKTRSIATGGLLKEYLKILETDPDDLIHADESGLTEADLDSPRVAFNWQQEVKRYAM